jgi:hypothetical protein
VTFDARAVAYELLETMLGPSNAGTLIDRGAGRAAVAALQSAYDAGRSDGRDEALREAETYVRGLGDGATWAPSLVALAIAHLRDRTPKGTP